MTTVDQWLEMHATNHPKKWIEQRVEERKKIFDELVAYYRNHDHMVATRQPVRIYPAKDENSK